MTSPIKPEPYTVDRAVMNFEATTLDMGVLIRQSQEFTGQEDLVRSCWNARAVMNRITPHVAEGERCDLQEVRESIAEAVARLLEIDRRLVAGVKGSR